MKSEDKRVKLTKVESEIVRLLLAKTKEDGSYESTLRTAQLITAIFGRITMTLPVEPIRAGKRVREVLSRRAMDVAVTNAVQEAHRQAAKARQEDRARKEAQKLLNKPEPEPAPFVIQDFIIRDPDL